MTTKKIVFTALFAALTAVCTMFVVIPVVGTEGFINIGDSMIFICALMMGAIPACIAGGIGSMLADILLGYAHWAPFTLVIKAIEGLICGLLVSCLTKKTKLSKFQILIGCLGMLVAGIEMVVGYFFGGWILQGDFYIAFASVPSNFIQAGMSIAIAMAIYIVLLKVNAVNLFKRMLIEKKQPVIQNSEKEQK